MIFFKHTGKRFIIITSALIIFNTHIFGQKSWPAFHGPNRDNISPAKKLLKKWPKTGPKLLWKATALGKGFSSVSIVDNIIYTAGTINNRTYIFAFNYEGKLKWKTPNGKKWKPSAMMFFAKNFDGSRSTPTIDEDMAYHLNELGRLAAFNKNDGKEIWNMDITKKFDAEYPNWAYAESVFIDNNNLLLYPGGKKGYMVALDKKTGKTVWVNKKIDDPASYCSLILIEENNIRQIITMSATAVLGINADNGKLLWRIEFKNSREINVSTPVYYQGHVIASQGYGGGSIGIKLTYKNKNVSAKKIWENDMMDNHHGGIMLYDNYIYGTGSDKKGWYCIDPKTGKTLLRDKEGGKGSITFADGLFYLYNEKGSMSLIQPSTLEFKVISSFKVPEGGKGLYWAHPVVYEGRLYVRHADNLYVYNIKK